MNGRVTGSTDNAELRAKIDQAKPILPMPALMRRLGYPEKHIGSSAYCPFHSDEHKSFSVFESKTEKGWQWKCFVACGYGDEIAFVVKHFHISRREAINRYLEMAGFPPHAPAKSREYPKLHASPAFPVSPVSEGQRVDGEVETRVKALAAQNACTQLNTARTRRFKLLRDLKAVEKELGRKLQIAELTIVFSEWHALSLPFLDPAKSRDHYEAKFLSECSKVRFATGEGTLATALENVAKLSPNELPIIPAKPNAPESWRRILTLHRELHVLSGKSGYFLSCRDAAKVFDGMSHHEAYAITGALANETIGAIKIVSNGTPNPSGGKAAEFRYLLAKTETAADKFEL